MFDVVVVCYNSAEVVGPCLEAMARQSLKPDSVTLVDNSPEGSDLAIRDVPVGVQLFRRPENAGFAGGCNFGASLGTAPLLLFLNPDVALAEDWLEKAARLLASRPEVGLIGGKLVYPDGRGVQHAGGTLHYPLATTSHRTEGLNEPQDDEPDYVTGAALAVKRDVFESLGGFDPQFWPVYYEDVDLCYRAKLSGWKVIYSPQLAGTHVESSSIDRDSFTYYFWLHRQRLRFVLKHYSTSQLLQDFIPAEVSRLRGDLSGLELQASLAAYADVMGPQLDTVPTAPDPGWLGMLDELQKKWELREGDFMSDLPLVGPAVAGLRRAINNLSARWYVLQFVVQQQEFNAAAFRLLRELVRRERSAEGAYRIAVGILGKRLQELEDRVRLLERGE